MLKKISVLAISLVFGFTGIVFAGGTSSSELDANDLNESVYIYDVSGIQMDYSSVGDSFVSGTGSSELDARDVDRSVPKNVDQTEKNDSRRLLCAASLGYTAEEHAADYCRSIQKG